MKIYIQIKQMTNFYIVIKIIFIDSGFLYSYLNKKDKNHEKTLNIMRSALTGEFG